MTIITKGSANKSPPIQMTGFRYHLMPLKVIDRSDNKKINRVDLMNKANKVNKTYTQYWLTLPYINIKDIVIICKGVLKH